MPFCLTNIFAEILLNNSGCNFFSTVPVTVICHIFCDILCMKKALKINSGKTGPKILVKLTPSLPHTVSSFLITIYTFVAYILRHGVCAETITVPLLLMFAYCQGRKRKLLYQKERKQKEGEEKQNTS